MEIHEIQEVYTKPLLDLIFQGASVHREHHQSNEIQICHLISFKTGGCPENCRYCAQSAAYQTMPAQPLMAKQEILARAKQAKQRGVTRICLGAAWREARLSPQFDDLLDTVTQISNMGLEVCCTLGLLNEQTAQKLKSAGLHSYNHNLDTSERHYRSVVTTRTYADRLRTLDIAQKAGLHLCCGGILGLGENQEDRISLLHTLCHLPKIPDSVPINLLVPIPGTPFADNPPVETEEVIRMIATARILMPKTMVRLTAGRMQLTLYEQMLCFLAGANSIFAGEKLLTVDNASWNEDEAMLKKIGLVKRPPYKCLNG